MRLDMEISGGEEIREELVGLGKRAADVRPAFRVIADDFLEIESRLFSTQGRGQWPPLKRRTVEVKKRAGLDPRIMHATGKLRDSLTSAGAGSVRRLAPGRLTVGTGVFYARFHPERHPLSVGEQDQLRWAEIVRRYVATGEVRRGIGL